MLAASAHSMWTWIREKVFRSGKPARRSSTESELLSRYTTLEIVDGPATLGAPMDPRIQAMIDAQVQERQRLLAENLMLMRGPPSEKYRELMAEAQMQAQREIQGAPAAQFALAQSLIPETASRSTSPPNQAPAQPQPDEPTGRSGSCSAATLPTT